MRRQYVVMICTAARGGMRAVVETYKADGLFEKWNVVLLSSHIEGSLGLRLYTAAMAFLKLFGLILMRRVSLVHCHAAMKGSFWRKAALALVARFAGIPVIFHLHGGVMKAFVARQPKLIQRLIGWVLNKQSVVLVLSESWREYVLEISPNSNVEILPNYVELPALSIVSGEGGDGCIRILYLGMIVPAKGIFDLLIVFKEAVIKIPSLRLIIGGIGELDKAQVLADELQIGDKVFFAGWVSGDEKEKLFRESQVFVLPSYFEGFPVSLLEAMSRQIPVISTRVGAIPELVRDGLDGLLIDTGDRAALTASLIQMTQDHELRKRMGISARERVEHNYSREVVLPRLEILYQSLIDSGNSKSIRGRQ